MIDYALNGLLIGIVGFALLKILDPARARARIAICLGAIMLVAVPWYWLGTWLSFETAGGAEIMGPAQVVGQVLQPVYNQAVPPRQQAISSAWYFVSLLAVGLLFFAYVAVRQYQQVASWRRVGKVDSELTGRLGGDIPVWLVPGESMAVATAFGAREIWLGERISDHPKLHVALTHEAAHHQLQHPLMEWVLTLLRCLFWWHPTVWLLVTRARQEIEIECDEFCASVLGAQSYQQDLAALFVDVQYVGVGAGFGGRGSFNITRIRRLTRTLKMGRRRVFAAFLTMLIGLLGFLGVHAEPSPEVEREHKGWTVRWDNLTLDSALKSVARMGGIDIYLDPRLETPTIDFEAHEVRDWQTLIEGAMANLDNVAWVERGGVVFVSSAASLPDPSWLPDAIILRSHGVGIFAKQNVRAKDLETPVGIDLKLEEIRSPAGSGKSQMEILIDGEGHDAVTFGDTHVSFDGSSNDGLLAVGLFKIAADSRLVAVGKGELPMRFGTSETFEWLDVDGVDYRLSVKLFQYED